MRVAGGRTSRPRDGAAVCLRVQPTSQPTPQQIAPRSIPGALRRRGVGLRRLRGLERPQAASDLPGAGGGTAAGDDNGDEQPAGGGWSPDLSEVDLDDEYYQFEDDKSGLDVDPEAFNLSMQEMEALFNDPDLLDMANRAADGGLSYGPQAAEEDLPEVVLIAGLRAEELPVVRVLMDKLGWIDTRVVPVTNSMLYEPLSLALEKQEPNWEDPRTDDWQGGGLGAERILLFSGLQTGMQATLVEILEQSGLPAVSIASVDWSTDQATLRLGEVLAKAVQEQRSVRKLVSRPVWADAPDVYGELGSVEEAVRRATQKEGQESVAEELAESSGTTPVSKDQTAASPSVAMQPPAPAEEAQESEPTEDSIAGDQMEKSTATSTASLLPPEANLIDVLVNELDLNGAPEVNGKDLDYAELRYQQRPAEQEEASPDALTLSPSASLSSLQETLKSARSDGLTRGDLQGILNRLSSTAKASEPDVREGSAALKQDEMADSPLAVAPSEVPHEGSQPKIEGSGIEVWQQSSLQVLLKEAVGAGILAEELKVVISRLNQSLISPGSIVLDSLDLDSKDIIRRKEEEMRSQGFVTKDEFADMMRQHSSNEQSNSAGPQGPGASTLNKDQLGQAAKRHGLDLNQLLEDADSRGIVIED